MAKGIKSKDSLFGCHVGRIKPDLVIGSNYSVTSLGLGSFSDRTRAPVFSLPWAVFRTIRTIAFIGQGQAVQNQQLKI